MKVAINYLDYQSDLTTLNQSIRNHS